MPVSRTVRIDVVRRPWRPPHVDRAPLGACTGSRCRSGCGPGARGRGRTRAPASATSAATSSATPASSADPRSAFDLLAHERVERDPSRDRRCRSRDGTGRAGPSTMRESRRASRSSCAAKRATAAGSSAAASRSVSAAAWIEAAGVFSSCDAFATKSRRTASIRRDSVTSVTTTSTEPSSPAGVDDHAEPPGRGCRPRPRPIVGARRSAASRDRLAGRDGEDLRERRGPAPRWRSSAAFANAVRQPASRRSTPSCIDERIRSWTRRSSRAATSRRSRASCTLLALRPRPRRRSAACRSATERHARRAEGRDDGRARSRRSRCCRRPSPKSSEGRLPSRHRALPPGSGRPGRSSGVHLRATDRSPRPPYGRLDTPTEEERRMQQVP